jgi:polysaccharide pyruvyl transferase WcaK-like protein
LRDDESQALVHEIGFTGESRVCPDAAYGLEVRTRKESAQKADAQPIVGFSPMLYPDPKPGGYLAERDQILYEAFILKLANFGAWLVSRSHELALFSTDFGVDPLAIKDVQRALMRDHGISAPQCRINESIQSVRDLLAATSGIDYVVTCRFHGVVFAHLLNKPVLAIAHHPKVAQLMTDLQLSSYCVDIRDFDADLLADKFTSMVINAEDIKSRMATSLTSKKLQLRRQFDELFRNTSNGSV